MISIAPFSSPVHFNQGVFESQALYRDWQASMMQLQGVFTEWVLSPLLPNGEPLFQDLSSSPIDGHGVVPDRSEPESAWHNTHQQRSCVLFLYFLQCHAKFRNDPWQRGERTRTSKNLNHVLKRLEKTNYYCSVIRGVKGALHDVTTAKQRTGGFTN